MIEPQTIPVDEKRSIEWWEEPGEYVICANGTLETGSGWITVGFEQTMAFLLLYLKQEVSNEQLWHMVATGKISLWRI